MLTGTSFPFGGQSVAGVAAQAIVGAVASRFTVTDFDAVPPSLVAVQVSVSPVVSLTTATVGQGGDEIADCGSLTSQLTVTSLVYQESSPVVPTTFATISGGRRVDEQGERPERRRRAAPC